MKDNKSKVRDNFFKDSRASQMADFSEIPQTDDTAKEEDPKNGTIDDAMKSEYNSETEVTLKKVLGVAITIADALGWIHLEDNSAEGIAIMVDKAIGVLKTAYKVARDHNRTEKYIEHLVEDNAIRVITFVESAIDAGKVIVPDLISNWLITMGIGNEAIRPAVQQIYSILSDVTIKYIEAGTGILKRVAKNFLTTAADTARDVYFSMKHAWKIGKQVVHNLI